MTRKLHLQTEEQSGRRK